MTIEQVYLCYSCLCVLFAAHGGHIPGSDEQAPEKLPGKVNKGVGREGLKLFSWSFPGLRPKREPRLRFKQNKPTHMILQPLKQINSCENKVENTRYRLK